MNKLSILLAELDRTRKLSRITVNGGLGIAVVAALAATGIGTVVSALGATVSLLSAATGYVESRKQRTAESKLGHIVEFSLNRLSEELGPEARTEAIAVLAALSKEGKRTSAHPRGLTEQIGIKPERVQRLLRELTAFGFIETIGEGHGLAGRIRLTHDVLADYFAKRPMDNSISGRD